MYTPQELLLAELDLREQQGFDPRLLAELRTAVSHPSLSPTAAEPFWQQLANLPAPTHWPYQEPDGLAAIQQSCVSVALGEVVGTAVPSKIHGGLLGRFAGMMLG
ncbi:MAG: hypothetical protein WAS33_30735, partial [Candidatus Promineifilaceae bacterium]